MNSIKTLLAILLLSLGSTGLAWSNELPRYYPETFANRGTIDRISANTAKVVIDDSLLSLSMNIKVHSLVTEHSSLRALKKGMKVGYTSTQSRGGGELIVELWVLPKNYSPSRQ